METTTKGMITTKNSLNKSNQYYLFHESPKTAARQLFKEVSMHHKKLPWVQISKVYILIEPKVSVPWHWNLVKWGKYVTNKRCPKQYYKNNAFLDRYGKNYFRSVNFYSPIVIVIAHYIYIRFSQHDKLF